MPLCISCRGEYSIPPKKNQKSLWQRIVDFTKKLYAKSDEKPEQESKNITELPWVGDDKENKPQEQKADTSLSEDGQESEEQTPRTELLPPEEDPETKLNSSSTNLPTVPPLTSPQPPPPPEEPEPYVCSRCGRNNENWDKWNNGRTLAHLARFFLSFWGLLVLLSFILPAFLARLFIGSFQSQVVLISAILASLLMFIVVVLLYTMRHPLWRYELVADVSRSFRPSLVWLAVFSFVLAMLFGTGSFFIVRAMDNSANVQASQIPEEFNTPTATFTPIPPTSTPTPPPTFTPTPSPTSTPTPTPTKKPCRPRFCCCW